MAYRCEATSLRGFIQQLAVCYVGRGYHQYVSGHVPEGKDPKQIDRKLVQKYQIDLPKWTRSRRRQQGRAGIQYIRHQSFFVLLASEGTHATFFTEEHNRIRDVRVSPIHHDGYSVGLRDGRVHVRVAEENMKDLRAYFGEIALRKSVAELSAEFYQFPFEPWGPVKTQVFGLLRLVNDSRKYAGLPLVPKTAVWLKRPYTRPFASRESSSR